MRGFGARVAFFAPLFAPYPCSDDDSSGELESESRGRRLVHLAVLNSFRFTGFVRPPSASLPSRFPRPSSGPPRRARCFPSGSKSIRSFRSHTNTPLLAVSFTFIRVLLRMMCTLGGGLVALP